MIRRAAASLVAIALAVTLAACGTAPVDLARSASSVMQDSVVSVAEAAAEGDLATAVAQLDELQQRLDQAIADGDVSAVRAGAIQASIDAVRADLEAAAAPEPSATPTPAAPATVDQGEETTAPVDTSTGNSGPGKNSGKGKGADKPKGEPKDKPKGKDK
ncbi:hypothetical protein [Microbacterium terricola]|uniref:Mucin-associated surface protein n=1 Tax=Microbacterium terricola TaxID=344163 RepID=A0ABM8E287_9MICO|nr:hypothetical protein [Microbacterium terricola]UYK40373.1 hypothetical protein OAU46_01605 [Microbacterium terricola]BDV31909.1 hypothetical protein Microterr_25690 [Microbacterium terricola]